MEPHNLDVVIFSEVIRKLMQSNKPPLIRHRRHLLFRAYTDVFVGSEAVQWATRNVTGFHKSSIDDKNNNDDKLPYLSENQVLSLYQKLMDAGLLRNVQTQEEFRNDRSLFRFSSDDPEAETLVRSVAIGYRLFESAHCQNCTLFQKVCALGQLVSSECIKSSDIVTWLIDNGLCSTRESAVLIASSMIEHDVIKPVDHEVVDFTDGPAFYVFATDYTRIPLTIQAFLSSKTTSNQTSPKCNDEAGSRNRLIHLRQTSDQLMDLSHLSLESQKSNHRQKRTKGLSTSSDDSGFNDNAASTSPSYQSLLTSDGSMTKEALFHPSAPYIKKDYWIYPDPVGYGFVIRGKGPCFIKIVDPDSPAGKAGLKASQFITDINGNNVTDFPHTGIEDMILNGPKRLKISIMQHVDCIQDNRKTAPQPASPPEFTKPSQPRQRSSPPLPSAQPWMKKRGSSQQIVTQ